MEGSRIIGVDCATDRFVHRRVGRLPLEVGADRIARTALAALELLKAVRSATGEPIPIVLSRTSRPRVSAIEVYPAATLAAERQTASGYKRAGERDVRKRMIEYLASRLTLPEDTELLESNADALDAVHCVLAGFDFLEGAAMPPEDAELAYREGWIWVREPEATGV